METIKKEKEKRIFPFQSWLFGLGLGGPYLMRRTISSNEQYFSLTIFKNQQTVLSAITF